MRYHRISLPIIQYYQIAHTSRPLLTNRLLPCGHALKTEIVSMSYRYCTPLGAHAKSGSHGKVATIGRYAAMCGHMRPCAATPGHMQPCVAICGRMRPYVSIRTHMQSYASIWGHMPQLLLLACARRVAHHLSGIAATFLFSVCPQGLIIAGTCVSVHMHICHAVISFPV